MTAFPLVPDPPLTMPIAFETSVVASLTAHEGLAPFSFAKKFRLVPVLESLHSSKVCAPVVLTSKDVAAYTVFGRNVLLPTLYELSLKGFRVDAVSIAQRIFDPIQNPIPRWLPVPAFSFFKTK